jgi:hypothetical protein
MTALGINFINGPHVDIYRWAKEKKIFLPLDFRRTPEEEKMFLKLLSLKPYFVRLTPDLERARFSEAMKEAMKYLPSNGFSDKTVMIFQVGGIIFFAIISVMAAQAKL